MSFVVLISIALAGCGPSSGNQGHGGPGGGMPPAAVSTMTVQPKTVLAPFEYTGQTAGSREVEVRARVRGILVSRNFTEGGTVKKGQSLYTIDRAPFEAALAKAEADLAGAQARLAQARRNVARLGPLHAESAVSQKDYDDAVSAETIGAADLKAVEARLLEARLDLAYARVEAPVSGIAGRSLPSEGTLISGPEVLLTRITQVDPIWVNFGIPDADRLMMRREAEAGRLVLPRDGRFEVRVQLADGQVYGRTGWLAFSDVRVSGSTGTSDARAVLPNAEGRLHPGQFVRVTLSGATRPGAVLVPQRAVLEGPQGKFVYVVDDKGTAQPRPVELGEWAGSDWIVTGGLKGGERVIIDGVMRIGPGSPVQATDVNAKPAAQAAQAAKQ
ncbi:MAG: efflux RND transporter periplasmic adaptor subunit [Betaproteobacteria bacterium]|nr:efflux RND transporter periplasmic adaptor subunit [Betaproteobacteria bacterium]MDH5219976.1 efflux RND transporter periplasmic adaptor subunit [Betaproteobacteria bacterium]MDH5349656.1 efflux RND transporter periplasmic adaptor subunit [Betaproteobacteria bacterium]